LIRRCFISSDWRRDRIKGAQAAAGSMPRRRANTAEKRPHGRALNLAHRIERRNSRGSGIERRAAARQCPSGAAGVVQAMAPILPVLRGEDGQE